MTDTTPMPVVTRHRPALIGRFTVGLAGLLAAGALVLGLALLVAMVVLPAPGTGSFDATTGPGWGVVAAHLGVGVVGGAAGQWARRGPWTGRVAVAVVVVVAVLVVLALSWWR